MRTFRNSKKAPDKNRIYTAGEKEYYSERKRRTHGKPINKSLQEDIKFMREELNLDKYKSLF